MGVRRGVPVECRPKRNAKTIFAQNNHLSAFLLADDDALPNWPVYGRLAD